MTTYFNMNGKAHVELHIIMMMMSNLLFELIHVVYEASKWVQTQPWSFNDDDWLTVFVFARIGDFSDRTQLFVFAAFVRKRRTSKPHTLQ